MKSICVFVLIVMMVCMFVYLTRLPPVTDIAFRHTKHVPMIIHQTAPKNKENWPHLWEMCQESWKMQYPDWTYRMWDDDDIRQLIHVHYPKYASMYDALPLHICRVDIARYFMLHHMGGLYADMDFFCFRPIQLPRGDTVGLVGSTAANEIVQNSLMTSTVGHPFWIHLVDEIYRFFIREPTLIGDTADYVLRSTGPIMLSRLQKQFPHMVTILPSKTHNSQYGVDCDAESCFATHAMTGCWASGYKCEGHNREELQNKLQAFLEQSRGFSHDRLC